MRLLRRRNPGEEDRPADAAGAGGAGAGAADGRRAAASGKGRPTPKRREAQRRRTGPVAPPPRTRREAYRRSKEQNAVRRVEYREGLRSGEEKYLTPRDRGPVRGLVRDIVDSRRNAGGMFLVVAFVVLVGYIIPDARARAVTMALWLTVFVLLVLDSIYLSIRIRRLVRQRHPDSNERLGRLVWYGISRSTMIRRWRVPKPRVSVGDKV